VQQSISFQQQEEQQQQQQQEQQEEEEEVEDEEDDYDSSSSSSSSSIISWRSESSPHMNKEGRKEKGRKEGRGGGTVFVTS